MGYSTFFSGQFRISPPLEPEQTAYLREFSETRRMARDVMLLKNVRDPFRRAVGLPIGSAGAYFVGTGSSTQGARHKRSVIDTNRPPAGQPGLSCDWVPDESGRFLVWNEGDKFYNYVEWLQYLITHFLAPWRRTLSGDVIWQGESDDDSGTIRVANNVVDALGPLAIGRGSAARRLKVFLCHASEDRRRVRTLGRRLTDDNIDVWLDEKRLIAGSDWELEIRKALSECDAIVLCLSSVSVSKRGFVQREMRIARAFAEDQPEGELFLFPVLLEKCEVPSSLQHLQRVDLQRRGEYARLLSGLTSRAEALTEAQALRRRRRARERNKKG